MRTVDINLYRLTFRQEVLAKSKIALGFTHLRPKIKYNGLYGLF
jgi:hypothetical protein